jgi:hypothetical protein
MHAAGDSCAALIAELEEVRRDTMTLARTCTGGTANARVSRAGLTGRAEGLEIAISRLRAWHAREAQ